MKGHSGSEAIDIWMGERGGEESGGRASGHRIPARAQTQPWSEGAAIVVTGNEKTDA